MGISLHGDIALHHSKVCFKCNVLKPLSDFYDHPQMEDGHVNKCKECNKKDVIENRLKRIEYYREYDRGRSKTDKRKKNATEQCRKWRKEDKRRQIAHSAVARAIKNGFLERSGCIICGNEKSEAHHEDYDFPLAIVWYCTEHHKSRHKEMILAEKEQ